MENFATKEAKTIRVGINFLSITLPIFTAITGLIYFVITWNVSLAEKFSKLDSKLDKYQYSCQITDSLKSRDYNEMKMKSEVDHTLLLLHDSQLHFLLAKQCNKK